MAEKQLRLRSSILIPIGFALFLISFIGFIGTYFLQQQLLDKEIRDRLKNANRMFSELVTLQSELLINISETLSHTETFEPFFLSRHRELLAQEVLPYFIKLRSRYKITHFYFHQPDGTCFLRVHNTDRYGDIINRHTMKDAIAKEGISSGVELGPLGTMTLRVVMPWRVDGVLIGYIELGKELDAITVELTKILDLELIVAIEKKFLDKNSWAEGLNMLGKTGDWDLLEDYVIVSSTMIDIPDEFPQNLKKHLQSDHELFTYEITHQKKTYKGGIIQLYDAERTAVGDIFAFLDYSEIVTGNKMFTFFASGCAMVMLIFFFLVSTYLKRVENNLGETMDVLSEEVDKNKQIAYELAQHRDNLDELVTQKTAELEENRAQLKVLSGFLPICAGCKSIRKKDGDWEQIESYIRDHSEADFSHSYCPECATKIYSEFKNE